MASPPTKLLALGPLEAPDSVEAFLQESLKTVTKLSTGLADADAQGALQSHSARSKTSHDEVCAGLLYRLLTCPTPTRKVPESLLNDLVRMSRDGHRYLVATLHSVAEQKYPKMTGNAREKLLWLVGELIKLKVQGMERIMLALMRQIPGGNLTRGSVWLLHQCVQLLASSLPWMYTHSFLTSVAIYTFLRLLQDLMWTQADNIQPLRAQVSKFCADVLRARPKQWHSIGRDVIRLLHLVANKNEDLKPIWAELMASTAAGTSGVLVKVLSTPTNRAVLQQRVTPDMETQLLFILSQVQFGQQKRYQRWFQSKYLSKPGSESLVPDLVRFVCAFYHPSNRVIASKVCPRWAVLGWLFPIARSPFFSSATRNAMLYDFLYFTKRDSIMNVEPAALLMQESLGKYETVTGGLVDHLCTAVESQANQVLRKMQLDSTSAAFNDLVRKHVIRSASAILTSPRLHPKLVARAQGLFKAVIGTDCNSIPAGAPTSTSNDAMANGSSSSSSSAAARPAVQPSGSPDRPQPASPSKPDGHTSAPTSKGSSDGQTAETAATEQSPTGSTVKHKLPRTRKFVRRGATASTASMPQPNSSSAPADKARSPSSGSMGSPSGSTGARKRKQATARTPNAKSSSTPPAGGGKRQKKSSARSTQVSLATLNALNLAVVGDADDGRLEKALRELAVLCWGGKESPSFSTIFAAVSTLLSAVLKLSTSAHAIPNVAKGLVQILSLSFTTGVPVDTPPLMGALLDWCVLHVTDATKEQAVVVLVESLLRSHADMGFRVLLYALQKAEDDSSAKAPSQRPAPHLRAQRMWDLYLRATARSSSSRAQELQLASAVSAVGIVLTEAQQRSRSKLVTDMQRCMSVSRETFADLVTQLFCMKDVTLLEVETSLLEMVASSFSPSQVSRLKCALALDEAVIFRSRASTLTTRTATRTALLTKSLVEASLNWDAYSQAVVWQLLCAEVSSWHNYPGGCAAVVELTRLLVPKLARQHVVSRQRRKTDATASNIPAEAFNGLQQFLCQQTHAFHGTQVVAPLVETMLSLPTSDREVRTLVLATLLCWVFGAPVGTAKAVAAFSRIHSPRRDIVGPLVVFLAEVQGRYSRLLGKAAGSSSSTGQLSINTADLPQCALVDFVSHLAADRSVVARVSGDSSDDIVVSDQQRSVASWLAGIALTTPSGTAPDTGSIDLHMTDSKDAVDDQGADEEEDEDEEEEEEEDSEPEARAGRRRKASAGSRRAATQVTKSSKKVANSGNRQGKAIAKRKRRDKPSATKGRRKTRQQLTAGRKRTSKRKKASSSESSDDDDDEHSSGSSSSSEQKEEEEEEEEKEKGTRRARRARRKKKREEESEEEVEDEEPEEEEEEEKEEYDDDDDEEEEEEDEEEEEKVNNGTRKGRGRAKGSAPSKRNKAKGGGRKRKRSRADSADSAGQANDADADDAGDDDSATGTATRDFQINEQSASGFAALLGVPGGSGGAKSAKSGSKHRSKRKKAS